MVIFADDISALAKSFINETSSAALKTEQIEGQAVAVFQEKLEEDTWTAFVVFPRPNTAVVATDEGYLREVLARMHGQAGQRALPNNLPEWKAVPVGAKYWALRHYDKADAAMDPTSPFGGKKTANRPDEKAVGLTFAFDPDKSSTATITYFSSDPNVLANAQKNLFPLESEFGFRELHARYRQAGRGIVAGSFDLDHIESAALFVFALRAFLGHAIYP